MPAMSSRRRRGSLAHGSWIMLANPDLTVSEGFVGTMVDATRSAAADVACLAPDIRYAANPSIVNSRGIEVDEIGIPAESDAGRKADPLAGPSEVFGPSTSGCLIRRDALAAVGGLEPLLRLHGRRRPRLAAAEARLSRLRRPRRRRASRRLGVDGRRFVAQVLPRRAKQKGLFRLHGPPGLSARLLRTVTEFGHASVQALSGGGTAGVRGRGAALRDAPVYELPASVLERHGPSRRRGRRPRASTHTSRGSRRKRAAESLMTRGDRRDGGPRLRPRSARRSRPAVGDGRPLRAPSTRRT